MSGHFVLAAMWFLQATGIKKHLPELNGDQDTSQGGEVTVEGYLKEYNQCCRP